jgi:hypothetical protein
MSMWLRHAKGSHQCSPKQWNRAHLPAQRYKGHSTGPKLSSTHQCIMKDGW